MINDAIKDNKQNNKKEEKNQFQCVSYDEQFIVKKDKFKLAGVMDI